MAELTRVPVALVPAFASRLARRAVLALAVLAITPLLACDEEPPAAKVEQPPEDPDDPRRSSDPEVRKRADIVHALTFEKLRENVEKAGWRIVKSDEGKLAVRRTRGRSTGYAEEATVEFVIEKDGAAAKKAIEALTAGRRIKAEHTLRGGNKVIQVRFEPASIGLDVRLPQQKTNKRDVFFMSMLTGTPPALAKKPEKAKLPDGFPLVLPDDAQLISANATTPFLAVVTTTKSVDELRRLYEKALAPKGYVVADRSSRFPSRRDVTGAERASVSLVATRAGKNSLATAASVKIDWLDEHLHRLTLSAQPDFPRK